MYQRIPDVALRLAQLGKPTFVNGRWRKAALSGRKMAQVKKTLRALGEDIPLKPLRDRSADKPLKLTKWERNREARQATIEENMKNMPGMILEYRKKNYELRQQTRKVKTEEELYREAITKDKGEKPVWQILKEHEKK